MYVQTKDTGEFGCTTCLAGPTDLGGFGQPSVGAAAAIGVGAFALWAIGLVVIGGVIIWVVRSIKKG